MRRKTKRRTVKKDKSNYKITIHKKTFQIVYINILNV